MKPTHLTLLNLALIALAVICSPIANAQTATPDQMAPAPGRFAIRGGIGTDVNLGLGVGVGARYAWLSAGPTSFEFGADFYYHNSSESKERVAGGENVTDKEVTTLTVFGVRGNGLFNYYPNSGGVYFIAGFGFVIANVNWTEDWTNEAGVKTYHDDLDVTSAGNIINFGIGMAWTSGFELRFETPLLYFYDSGNATSFAPTFTLTALYQFK